ncbi:MAG: YhcH/YjgK/YiaL family protein [Bacteroidota bacterium]|nr:YhcH/YjgK/YiaL family protein [Bacteroidota bacterium]
MNHKQFILRALTSVSLITAVVISLNASGQSRSNTKSATDNTIAMLSTQPSGDQNIVVTQTEKNNNMTESKQKAKETVLEWFKAKPWFKNVKLTPSPSINLDELKKYYAIHPDFWEKAFEYFKNTDILNLAPGKYPIDGENVFAAVSEYNTQEPAERKWESHKKYIDVQIVLSGKELMGKAPYAEATPDIPYSEEKDIEFRKVSNGKDYLAQPGMFFIFFPSESHRPNQKAGEIVKVKKVVFKIKAN